MITLMLLSLLWPFGAKKVYLSEEKKLKGGMIKQEKEEEEK
jgi:hypothetical protein